MRSLFNSKRIRFLIGLILTCLIVSAAGTVKAAEKEYHIKGMKYYSQENNTFAALCHNLDVLSELSGVVFDDDSELFGNDDANDSSNDTKQYVVSDLGSSVYDAELYINSGADGFMICPSSEQVLPEICRMCEEAKVYWGIYYRSIKDEEIRKLCEDSPYYVGNTYEKEEDSAYKLAKAMLDYDYHKIAIISEQPWDTTCEQRERGLQRAIEEAGDVEIVAEIRNMQSIVNVRESIKSLLTAYPELECIYLVGSKVINAQTEICQIIKEECGDSDLGLVTFDFSNRLIADFESGVLKAAYGLPQMSLDPYYLAIKMVNAVKGFPLEKRSTSHCLSGILIESLEQAVEMADVIENWDLLFFSEEYIEHNLFKWNNPSLDEESFQRIIDNNIYLENRVLSEK
ncbi:MAG: sugar ABC transporter substrate-binding protein [Blautia sp.]|nr:sugar ABC transporter substrate-binding protein [Blautia sp.]